MWLSQFVKLFRAEEIKIARAFQLNALIENVHRCSFNGIIEEGDSKRMEKKKTNHSFVSEERIFFPRPFPQSSVVEKYRANPLKFDPRKYLPLTAVSFHWKKPSELRASEFSIRASASFVTCVSAMRIELN